MLLALPVLSLLGCVTCVSSLPKVEVHERAVDTSYIFASFSAQNEKKDDEASQLNIYTSDDGLNYVEFALDTYQPAEGLVRDPSIIKYLDKYYVVHTTGWEEPTIGIISSEDLLNWEPVATITMPPWTKRAWAPEFFSDPTDESLNIIVSLQGTESGSIWEPYLFTATQGPSLEDWSEPELLGLVPNTKHEPHIDMFVVYNEPDQDRPYHAFVKNEAAKHIEHWKAGSLRGPYDWVGSVGNGKWRHREGPALTKIMNNGVEKWLMLMDDYKGTMHYTLSENLDDWEDQEALPTIANAVRHGTIISQVTL